jgi:hypothetical protein
MVEFISVSAVRGCIPRQNVVAVHTGQFRRQSRIWRGLFAWTKGRPFHDLFQAFITSTSHNAVVRSRGHIFHEQGLWRQHRGLFVQQNSCTRWLRHPSLATSSLPHVQVAHSSLRSCRSQFKCYGFHTAEKNQILGRSAAQGTNVLIIPPMSSDPPIQPLRRMYTLGWRKCRGIRVDRWKQMYDLPSQQEWSWRITATLTIAQPSLHREKKKM